MKRKVAIIMAVMLGVGVFSGCKSEQTEGLVQKSENEVTESIQVSESTKAPAIKNTIFAEKTVWKGNDNLYEISLDVLDGISQSEIYRLGNDLLLAYTQYDTDAGKAFYYVKLISVETGDVQAEFKLDSLTYGTIQLLDDGFAIKDLGEGKCWVLDENLQLTGKYQIHGGAFALNQKGDTAYVFSYLEGIKSVELATYEEQILFDDLYGVYLCDSADETATFSCIDKSTLIQINGLLNLENGQIQMVDSEYAYGYLEGTEDVWLAYVENTDADYVIGTNDGQQQFTVGLSADMNFNSNSGQIVMAESPEDGQEFMAAYDIDGTLVSECQTTDLRNSFYNDIAWYEEYGAYVFTMTDINGIDHLFFWDVTAASEGENLVLSEVSDADVYPVGTAVAQEYYDWAKQLSEKYDVRILIADQCDTEFSDHTAKLLLDESAITQALNTIDYTFSRYPEGFFSQLKHASYREIEIQVLGTLTKAISEGDVSYISGGFVSTERAGELLMTLDARELISDDDINEILAETIYHEFSHIIDKRLEFVSQYREDAVYSDMGWEALNPKGFKYNDTYYGTLDPQYESYFVNAYACTNGTEDRACTMEYAMGGYVSMFEEKSGLADKLEYYCQGIRDGFDTTGWSEELPWEETLNAVR